MYPGINIYALEVYILTIETIRYTLMHASKCPCTAFRGHTLSIIIFLLTYIQRFQLQIYYIVLQLKAQGMTLHYTYAARCTVLILCNTSVNTLAASIDSVPAAVLIKKVLHMHIYS